MRTVDQHRVDLVNALLNRECNDIIGCGSVLAEMLDTAAQLSPQLYIYSIVHHHESGDSVYLVWSDHRPTEAEAISVLQSEFEPEKTEWLSVEIWNGEIPVLKSE